jgi:malonyl-CoA O-methyltransferase
MRPAAPLDEYQLDMRALRRAFDRASKTYAVAAVVQAELRARLLERLDLVKLSPERVLDLGAASGQSTRLLKQRYPQAQVLGIDLSQAMLREARREQTFFKRFDRAAMDAHALALKDASVDLVFSNLMLAWCNHPDQVFREAGRVLKPDGLFMFTSLGPDTLREVRERFRQVDERTHVHRFIDMHDLGDALMRTGFLEPVMDTERLTVTYPSASALFREIKSSGSTNVSYGRRPGLLGRKAMQDVQTGLESKRTEAGFSVTLEVVYGHAWRGTPRAATSGSPGEIAVPISQIRRR